MSSNPLAHPFVSQPFNLVVSIKNRIWERDYISGNSFGAALCLDRKYDLARVQRRSDQVSVLEIKRCREIGECNTAGVARLSQGGGWGAHYSHKCLHLRSPRAER